MGSATLPGEQPEGSDEIGTLKTCRQCKAEFEPQYNSTQVVCGHECAVIYTRSQSVAKRKRAINLRTKNDRERIKTISDHKRQTQQIFNNFIRLRDSDRPCISCGQSPNQGQRHASHYRPRSTASQLAYNFLNCWASCAQCNGVKSGNISEYRLALVKILTPGQLAGIENNTQKVKYTKEYLKRLQDILKRRIKLYKSLRGISAH